VANKRAGAVQEQCSLAGRSCRESFGYTYGLVFWACVYSANSFIFFGMMLSDYLGLESLVLLLLLMISDNNLSLLFAYTDIPQLQLIFTFQMFRLMDCGGNKIHVEDRR
jgi:hypothetical protein